MAPASLLDLPDELLMNILSAVSTPSFVQVIATCTKLYNVAADSRDVILHHLHAIPGIKLGLDDFTVRTEDLFLLLRQRASRFLYGAQFTADCTEFRYRNVLLDADASCMAEMGTDYTTISAVLKDSLDIRLYGSRCALKEHIESPYADGEAKVLQVVHRRFTISILYQWKPGPEAHDPNIDVSIPHMTTAEKLKLSNDERSVGDESGPKVHYHLLHYNAYTMDKPFFFVIDQYKDLVPTFLAVHSRLHCAIIWDKHGHGLSPSDHTEIVLYTASKCPINEEGFYVANVVWPTLSDARPVPASKENIAKGRTPRRLKRIAFYKDGRRLRMYAPGQTVPWHVIGTSSTYDPQAQLNIVTFPKGTTFRIDTPFYGHHETYTDIDDQTFCNISHLCFGVAGVDSDSDCKILCILRSKVRSDHDDCRHMVDLGRMAHVTAEDCTVVARLWGWQEPTSSLTGLETVAVSKLGTRIAIAIWNRVLIWALDPRILCEDVQDAESDEEEVKPKKKKRKVKVKHKGVADDFYTRRTHPILGWRMAELKPVVLDLQGAIARKMTWTVVENTEDSDDSDDDEEEERAHTNTSASTNDGEEDEGLSSEISGVSAGIINILCTKSKAVIDGSTAKGSAVTCAPGPPQSGIQEGSDGTSEALSNETGERLYKENPSSSVETLIPSLSNVAVQESDSAQPSDARPFQPSQEPLQDQTVNPANVKSDADPTIAMTILPTGKLSSNTGSTAETSMPITPSSDPKGKGREELDIHVTDNIGRPVAIASSWSSDSVADKKSSTRPKTEDEINNTTLTTGCPPRVDVIPPTKRHRKRHTEDELVIMTDRGIQVWDLGPWGKGRRTKEWLAER